MTVISRRTILENTDPIEIVKHRPGFSWSVRVGPTAHFWHAGGRTFGTEDEVRREAEDCVLSIIGNYRERIPCETEMTYEEFAETLGVRRERLTLSKGESGT